MNLVSIINAWSDTVELLPACIDNHLQFCDHVMVVASSMSNRGQSNSVMAEFIRNYKRNPRVSFEQFEPFLKYKPVINETAKRNLGIIKARERDFTHFIICDADEFYDAAEMNAEKYRFHKKSLNGLVHPLKVYIKTPTLYTEDHTLVCGIHKLTKEVSCGNFKYYPFAYDNNGQAHIDPSRRMSFTTGIEMSSVYMHHYSYVRRNIDLKIENSTAKLTNSRQVIHEELNNAAPGYISKLYHRPLKSCPNYFNIVI